MISSRQNARFKDIRRVRRCKDDRALLDGPKLIGEALDSGLDLQSVLVTSDFKQSAAGRQILLRLHEEPLEISAGLLKEITDGETPQGIVAVTSLPRPRVEETPQTQGHYLFLDGIQDPGNLGALARVAEAAGAVAAFASSGSAHPNHPRALRASAGSLLRLPWVHQAEIDRVQTHLAHLNPDWIQLDAGAERDLFDSRPAASSVLVIGSEGRGVSPKTVARCNRSLRIPMASPVESLNAATAAAIVLFELGRQRRP